VTAEKCQIVSIAAPAASALRQGSRSVRKKLPATSVLAGPVPDSSKQGEPALAASLHACSDMLTVISVRSARRAGCKLRGDIDHLPLPRIHLRKPRELHAVRRSMQGRGARRSIRIASGPAGREDPQR